MPTNVKVAIDRIQMLTGSPIHGVKPLGEYPVEISLLDTDPTNPGPTRIPTDTNAGRNQLATVMTFLVRSSIPCRLD